MNDMEYIKTKLAEGKDAEVEIRKLMEKHNLSREMATKLYNKRVKFKNNK